MNIHDKTIFCIVATNGASLINFRGPFIRALVQRGLRVVCVSIEPDEEIGESVRGLGAEYRQITGDRVGIGVFSGLKMIHEYKKFFLELQPDYLFLYMSKPIAFGGWAAVQAKVPHINILVNGLENAYYRTGLKDALVRSVMSFFYKYVASHSDNVFFQNHDDQKYFIEHGMLEKDNSCVVGGSGVDMEYFKRQPLPQEPVVLLTARLLWSKGIREFFEAIKIVKKKHPEVKVMLVGGLDDNDEAIKQDELDEFIHENDVEYCGYAKDVRPYLARCSIFVLPSYHEGLPRSVIEAMAVGRPIITTDVPGCRETVEDGINGYLIPSHDYEVMADRLDALISDSTLRLSMSEKSYQKCSEQFDVVKVNQTMFSRIFD